MTEFSESWWADLFAPCNRTELYQICRRKNIEVLPGAPRAELIQYIIGNKEPPVLEHPIDAWRHGIMGVIIEHQDVVRATLSCPAKTLEPDACFQCTDTQVVSCIVQNPNDEPLIATHRLVRHRTTRNTDMAQDSITLENAPRDLAAMQTAGAFRLNALARILSKTINPQTGKTFVPTMQDTTPEAKALWVAFMCGLPEKVAAVLHPFLLQYDQVMKAGGAAAPAAVATPPVAAFTAPAGGVVMPTGPIPGGAAEAPQKAPRTPKPSAPDNNEFVAMLKGIEAALNNNTAAINAMGVSVGKLVVLAEQNSAALQSSEKLESGMIRSQMLTMALLLQISTVVLQESMPDIAEQAAGLADMVPGFFEPGAGKG